MEVVPLWKTKKVSVVFPTFNEKDSIRRVIEEFSETGYVDEIIVVNNNAADGTREEVEKTNASQVFETKQGYGYAMQRGMQEATGDLIILSEPDGTFSGSDVIKLLAYSDDFDVVFGSRTTPKLIEYRANMGLFLRAGNWLVAKLIEFLFLTGVLTDVGCSMKLVSRNAYEKIKNDFTIGSSHFNPELMCLVIMYKINFIEIPVKYKEREGKSMVTGNSLVAFLLGLKMIGLIFKYRFLHFFTDKYKIKNTAARGTQHGAP
jgi:glycosyltransferase involved in cell wall biosynthesis